MRPTLPLVALLLLAPAALAQPTGAIDATIELSPDAPPDVSAPEGLVRLEEASADRFAFNLTLTKEYTTFEVRARGFDIERPKQIFPSLDVEDQYPLFERFPSDEIWDVEGAANVYTVNGTADDVVLRLGVAGPRNVTLLIARDVEPPGFELGPVSELQHIGFYQETTTTEMALADLQVRRAGADEWVQNPTPAFHVIQRFPVQGLDPETEYEARIVFIDWSENEVVSDVYTVRTPPAPVGPAITITPLSPEPNATILPGSVSIRARIESPDSPIGAGDVRLFFDKREVTEKLRFEGIEAVYTPETQLTPGPHSVAFEARNEAGGTGVARWSFEIEGPKNETSALALAPLAASLALALALRRRP